jgi:hypothetical protein
MSEQRVRPVIEVRRDARRATTKRTASETTRSAVGLALALGVTSCAASSSRASVVASAEPMSESETSASSTSSLEPLPPIEDDDEHQLRDLPSAPLEDRGACVMPVATPEASIHPNEEPVHRELAQVLHDAPRVYHFGGRWGDRCHLVCDGTHVLCGANALTALRARWRESHEGIVVSRWTARTMVGVFENYWQVRPDGSAVHWYHARTDVSPSRCSQCGWNREVITDFMRDDGTPRLRAPGTSGN